MVGAEKWGSVIFGLDAKDGKVFRVHLVSCFVGFPCERCLLLRSIPIMWECKKFWGKMYLLGTHVGYSMCMYNRNIVFWSCSRCASSVSKRTELQRTNKRLSDWSRSTQIPVFPGCLNRICFTLCVRRGGQKLGGAVLFRGHWRGDNHL